MYVTKQDYKTRITDDLLNIIIEQEDGKDIDILDDASKFAEDMLLGYAGSFYDVAGEFAKVGNARNYFVLNWALNIAAYIIYQRVADDQVPEKVIKNYDDTIADLQKVANEDLAINLPPAPSDDTDPTTQNEGIRRMGSKTPRDHSL